MGFRWLCSHETSIKAPPPTAYVSATMNNSCFWQCAKFKKVFLIPLFFTPQYIRALLLLFISTYFGQIHLDGNLSLTKYSIILSRILPNKRNFFSQTVTSNLDCYQLYSFPIIWFQKLVEDFRPKKQRAKC